MCSAALPARAMLPLMACADVSPCQKSEGRLKVPPADSLHNYMLFLVTSIGARKDKQPLTLTCEGGWWRTRAIPLPLQLPGPLTWTAHERGRRPLGTCTDTPQRRDYTQHRGTPRYTWVYKAYSTELGGTQYSTKGGWQCPLGTGTGTLQSSDGTQHRARRRDGHTCNWTVTGIPGAQQGHVQGPRDAWQTAFIPSKA
eukprot:1148073-Pelagomonas_calceolata.AAC.2